MAKKDLQALVAEQKILNKIYAVRGEIIRVGLSSNIRCLRHLAFLRPAKGLRGKESIRF